MSIVREKERQEYSRCNIANITSKAFSGGKREGRLFLSHFSLLYNDMKVGEQGRQESSKSERERMREREHWVIENQRVGERERSLWERHVGNKKALKMREWESRGKWAHHLPENMRENMRENTRENMRENLRERNWNRKTDDKHSYNCSECIQKLDMNNIYITSLVSFLFNSSSDCHLTRLTRLSLSLSLPLSSIILMIERRQCPTEKRNSILRFHS